MSKKAGKTIKAIAALFIVPILTACFGLTVSAAGNDPVEYIDENGDKQYCTDYILLNTDNFIDKAGLSLEGGWYVVRGNVEYDNRMIIDADYNPAYAEKYDLQPVRIILCDNCTLNLNNGLNLNSDRGLAIYAQSGGSGTLNAKYTGLSDKTAHAVIGGDAPYGWCGFLDINGGIININGQTSGASIGGSVGGSLDAVNIRGGKISIVNTKGAPAVGTGLSYTGRNQGIVNITGGDVYVDSYCRSQRTSDAIGSHYECGGLKELNITGGKITAFGRYQQGDLPPCAMMTYGVIKLGSNITVAAGMAPDQTSPVAVTAGEDRRVDTIRNNCYVVLDGTDDNMLVGSLFVNGSLVVVILGIAVIFCAAVTMTVLKLLRSRKENRGKENSKEENT